MSYSCMRELQTEASREKPQLIYGSRREKLIMMYPPCRVKLVEQRVNESVLGTREAVLDECPWLRVGCCGFIFPFPAHLA